MIFGDERLRLRQGGAVWEARVPSQMTMGREAVGRMCVCV